MPACASTTAAPSVRTSTRSIRKGTKPTRSIAGLGTLYTWNIVSPRLGVTTKLTADGRTMLRASYGRFSQGVLTGEFGAVPPRCDPDHDGGLQCGDRRLHDHRLGRRSEDPAPARSRDSRPALGRVLRRRRSRSRPSACGDAGVRPQGRQRTSSAGRMSVVNIGQQTRTLPDGSSVPVLVLVNCNGRSSLSC